MTTQTSSLAWADQLVEQLDWHWRLFLRPRLDGMTDAEYFWEPVDGCWSIRPRSQAITKQAAGGGELVADFEFPEPEPPPLTTIAWRLGHISVGVLGVRASAHFGDGSLSYQNALWPGSAAEALGYLDEQYTAWMDGVRSLSTEELARPCGPAEGPWAESPFAALVLHINREVLHHGAEVMLIRDLYRTSDQGQNWAAR